MSLIDVQCIKYGPNVVASAFLRVMHNVFWHVRWRVASGIKGDATIMLAEISNLRLIGTTVAGKFMNKDHRDAGAQFLIVELDPIVGRQMRHNGDSFVSALE